MSTSTKKEFTVVEDVMLLFINPPQSSTLVVAGQLSLKESPVPLPERYKNSQKSEHTLFSSN